MSVDTRDKRMSLIGLSSPVPSVLPNPDGAFDAADRSMLLWLYYGVIKVVRKKAHYQPALYDAEVPKEIYFINVEEEITLG